LWRWGVEVSPAVMTVILLERACSVQYASEVLP
jgi:hypothetical protein